MEGPTRPGTLYVVATPIGNLGDITLRALEVLRSVAVVAAEDTRLTRRLWERHGIGTPLVSYHAHSDSARTRELLARLAGGEDVALVTDAGTPLVSDPGEDLVGRWIAAGDRGAHPGAVRRARGAGGQRDRGAALDVRGLPAPEGRERTRTPGSHRGRRARHHRLRGAGADGGDAPGPGGGLRCGSSRALCRELTKRFEEVRRGTLGRAGRRAGGRGRPKARSRWSSPARADRRGGTRTRPGGRAAEVQALVDAGMPRSAAAREVASRTGLSRRALFDRAEPEAAPRT